MKDRIIKFLKQENLTATKFADEIGVQRSSVSHILSGRNNPSFEFIQKILTRYKTLNAEWLILGNGSMYKKHEQADLFASVATLSPPKTIETNLVQKPVEKTSSPEFDKNIAPAPDSKISVSPIIEKILIFYSDKTFEEYFPANNKSS
jgi:transcriptional regulator with XRE-family HTH domain